MRTPKNNALVGYSGFIGSTLRNQMEFSSLYNSKTIGQIENKEFDMVVSCGNSSLKWFANKNPEADFQNILSFIDIIKTVKAKKFVLLSSIDVYEHPYDVDENTVGDCSDKIPYGKHRLFLENFVRNHFEDHLIVRLPIVYGDGFKKNIIFDALNNHQIEKINPDTQIQIYNVKHIGSDIQDFLDRKLESVNIATEPLIVRDLFRDVFDVPLTDCKENYWKYDMKTIHAEKGYYQYSREYLIEELKIFKRQYETK